MVDPMIWRRSSTSEHGGLGISPGVQSSVDSAHAVLNPILHPASVSLLCVTCT